MTTGAQLDSISTVADVSAWKHLISPSDGITINTSVTSLQEENAIMLAGAPNTASLIEEVVAQIAEVKDTESIQETIGESVDGIC